MKNFTIEAQGEARELYAVEAESEEEARELFRTGQVQHAYMTECSGMEITSIEEDDA